MKKLMILAATAMLGVVANAATAAWSAYPIYEKGSTTPADGYIGYYIDQAQYSAALTALTSGNFADIASIGYASDGVSQYGGYITGSGAGSYGSSENVTAYLVVFNAATITDATYGYISSSATGVTGDAGQSANIDFTSAVTSMQTGNNWYAAVPEPTSGLLLLIGMAGLALRRRRA